MKILISGGIKTQNIVDGLLKKFNNSGVEFIVVPFIEDIDSIYQMGQYFDRAVIIEQCWSRDEEITDENVKRNKINSFAHTAFERNEADVEFIFLTQTEDEAEMVHEEILPIIPASTVVVKAPRYTVTFFAMLATLDVAKIDPEIIYNSLTYEENIIEEMEQVDESPDYNTVESDDLEADLLGGIDGDIFGDLFDDGDDMWDNEHEYEELEEIEEPEPEAEILEDPEIEEEEIIADKEIIETEELQFDADIWNEKEYEFTDEDIEDLGDFIEVEDQLENSFDIGNIFEDQEQDKPKQEFTGNTGNIDESLLITDNEYDLPKEDLFSLSNEVYDKQNNKEDTHTEEVPEKEKLEQEDQEDSGLLGKLPKRKKRQKNKGKRNKNVSKRQDDFGNIKETLDAFASRGNSMVITGCGGSGNSTIAFNLANTIVNAGYTCLVVDMDVESRAQSYISKDNYESMDHEDTGLISAINSSYGIQANVAIAKPGLHLLTMGMGTDIRRIEDILDEDKITRFANLVRNNYNFIVYDIPFKVATKFASDVTLMSDNIVITIDSSAWGITKTMLQICNVDSDDMQDTLFGRAQILYSKYRGLDRILDTKITNTSDIAKAMDEKVYDIIGEDTGYYFQDMHVCGVIDQDEDVDCHWFERGAYSDGSKGREIYNNILLNILLKR